MVTKGMGIKHSVTVRLGSFAVETLAGGPGRGVEPSSADVERAIQFYLSQSRRQGPGWAYPAFMRSRGLPEEIVIELDVDDSLWASLEKEAARQDIVVARLLEHVALYYAAQVDSTTWPAEPPPAGGGGGLKKR
jgi:hypothetical protein